MNKLNTFLSFVLLSFCLLINVSSAKVFNNVTGTINSTEFNELVANSINPTELTERDSYIINSAIEYLTKNNLYDPTNFSYYFVRNTSNSSYKIYRAAISAGRNPTYVMAQLYNDGCKYALTNQGIYISDIVLDNSNNFSYCSDFTVNTSIYNLYFAYYDTASSTLYTYDDITTVISSVDLALYTSNPNFGLIYYQTGLAYAKQNPSISVVNNYYMYGTAPDEPSPDEPTMPTNSEIASVVQSFYDSDLYKNNTNFKDFMVVYSFVTGYYSIIGTDNHLLQEIYYDGAKPSNDDFTYPETWWRFYNYFGNAQNLFYGWDYWLYSTRKENDVFLPLEYNGVGKINDLFNLKFTNQSIIVYSSYEYKVYEFYPPTEEGEDNSSTVTTIPGDEYTYDENLNPTDSNYSPIQNYIPVNPSQTILGDVDFDEINKTFEENKDILNIEGASWLFTANNKLVGYFIGFLSLLIVFLIISRILGG